MAYRQSESVKEENSASYRESEQLSEKISGKSTPFSSLAGSSGNADEQTAVLQRLTNGKLSRAGNVLLQLQNQYGNHHVQNVVNRAHIIQTKLILGPVDDPYEREANEVATQVVSQINTPTPRPATNNGETQTGGGYVPLTLQRHPNHAEEEEVKRKPLAGAITPLIQRHPHHAKEEEIKRKPLLQRHGTEEATEAGGQINSSLEQQLFRQRGKGSPLPTGLRSSMESGFGVDFSQVRLHTDGEAGQMNEALRARAFTHGNDIYFGSGYYNPGSGEGQRLLAHELTHVVQQTGPAILRQPEETTTPLPVKQQMTGAERASRLSFDKKTWQELTTEEQKKYSKLNREFRTQIGPGQEDKNSSYTFSDEILEEIRNVLVGQLPSAHSKGNAALKRIRIVDPDPKLPVSGASSFNKETGDLNIVVPAKNTQYTYAKMLKRSNMFVPIMEYFTNKGFNFSKLEQESLGITGDRALFGQAFRTGGSFFQWTVRHETGHSVDAQIKFTEKRSRLPEFGGWKQYGDKKAYSLKDLAKVYLEYAGIASNVYNENMDFTKIQKYTQRYPVVKEVRKVHNVSSSLLEIFTQLILQAHEWNVGRLAKEFLEKFKHHTQDWPTIRISTWLQNNEANVQKALTALRVGAMAPFTLPDGGPYVINGRIYQRDLYGTWTSYLKAARQYQVSNYQFSSATEWFAEAYAAYYDPDEHGSGDKLSESVEDWFEENLGPAPVDNEQKETGSLVSEEGKLQELGELNDYLYDYVADNSQRFDSVSISLEGIMDVLAQNEYKAPAPDQAPNLQQRIQFARQLHPGDILLYRGNTGVQWGQGAASVVRMIGKAVTVVGLYHAGKEATRLGKVNYGHAIIYIGDGEFAHAVSNGVVVGPDLAAGTYDVFRTSNNNLSAQAAHVGRTWGEKSVGYSKGKVWGAAFGSSNIDVNRAVTLGVYARFGIAPLKMICSEFVISCYQAAAVLPQINQLPQLTLQQLEQAVADLTDPQKKARLRRFAQQQQQNINVPSSEETLGLDPKTTPQRLAVKLNSLAEKVNPSWAFAGTYYSV